MADQITIHADDLPVLVAALDEYADNSQTRAKVMTDVDNPRLTEAFTQCAEKARAIRDRIATETGY